MRQFKVPIYSGLSKENKKNCEIESITNQKVMLTYFANSREDLDLVSTRIHDGYNGTSFECNVFKSMIEDIKNRKINCILVKYFSRFAIDLIEVGSYLEEVYSLMNVHFISFNDNYNSFKVRESKYNLIMSFKSLINSLYLRDISLKLKCNFLSVNKELIKK